MIRTFLAALLACGMAAPVSAQSYFYSGPSTSYYAPASYSNYSYTSGYGPMRMFDPRWWAGAPPYRAAYAPSYYGSTAYTASYSPMYTASYSPVMTTGYYAPTMDASLAGMSPMVVASNACCSPCVGCSSCASGNCENGNCGMNYAPSTGTLRPEPDPASSGSSGSGSSGSRTFESQSGGNRNGSSGGTAPGTNGDNFEPYNRDRPSDGFGTSGARGAGYRPESGIKQKAPMDVPEDPAESESKAAEPEADVPADGKAPAVEAPAGTAGVLTAPGADEPDASLPALNLDSKVTAAPSLLRERTRIKARFGSPQLARAKFDPATIPAAADLRLVKK